MSIFIYTKDGKPKVEEKLPSKVTRKILNIIKEYKEKLAEESLVDEDG